MKCLSLVCLAVEDGIASSKALEQVIIFLHLCYFFSSYEIQVEPGARARGLGKFLMQILEMMAHRFVKP